MTTLTAYELKLQPGIVRETMRRGEELAVTYHRKPMAQIIPHDRVQQERAELAALRAEVEELRRRLGIDLTEGVPA
ncbi:hypothetical protein [Amycolatopsis minnesotensis]|uniref:Antitoxin n=1 Tax=Amycolatopsis minnesotensis TaxID=337894 RepID=A0ABN2SCA0_9PSEU